MALQSMTGFARAAFECEAATVSWELRSVNGRGLDARLRIPHGFEQVEQSAKQRIMQRFSRGNIQANLTVQHSEALRRPVVDEVFLEELAKQARRLEDEYGAAPARADGLLALRGVLEMPDSTADEETHREIEDAALRAFETALDELESARRAEGDALKEVISGQIDSIDTLAERVEADPSRETESIRARLGEQVQLILDAAPSLEEGRLYQEAALLAAKADIREEIDRLKTHVGSARSLLENGGPIGRKLDFLAQEFNREANTLCSKSNASSVTAIGLELKVVVDQLREQVQNLE